MHIPTTPCINYGKHNYVFKKAGNHSLCPQADIFLLGYATIITFLRSLKQLLRCLLEGTKTNYTHIKWYFSLVCVLKKC